MFDPASIAALLAAGAIAKAGDLGGEMVSDAYKALKALLQDGYRFVTGDLLEKKPKDPHVLKTVEADIDEDAARDPEVARLADALKTALETVPDAAWKRQGVLVEGLMAKRDIKLGKVSGAVTIRNLDAGQDIEIGDISG